MINKIQAGDTFKHTVIFPEYPASEGWSCSMLLRGAGAQTIESTADGDNFILSASATETAEFAAGNYEYFIYVSKDSDRYLAEKGSVEVLKNYSETTVYDPRSRAKLIFDAVEAALLGRATKDQMSYEIAGRKIEKIPIPDLLALRTKFKNEVEIEKQAERIAAGLGAGNKVRVRFLP